jgi:Flp pilus assembly protein TadD
MKYKQLPGYLQILIIVAGLLLAAALNWRHLWAGHLIRKSRASFAAGDYKKTADILNEAASTDPENPDVWWRLCSAYRFAGEFDLALKACKRQVQLLPHDWKSYRDLGYVYLGKTDFAQAAAAFGEATLLSSDFELHDFYVRSLLASKQYDKAIPAAQRLLELAKIPGPDHDSAYEYLGIAYAKTRQRNKAQEAFRNEHVGSCELTTDESDMDVDCVGNN